MHEHGNINSGVTASFVNVRPVPGRKLLASPQAPGWVLPGDWQGAQSHAGSQGGLSTRRAPSPLPLVSFQVVPRICPRARQDDTRGPAEAGGPGGENLGSWALQSGRALALEVRRARLARRAEELEWELSQLLRMADGSRSSPGGR